MSRTRWFQTAGGILLALGMGACSDPGGPESENDVIELADVAEVAGEAAAADVAMVLEMPDPAREGSRTVERSVTFFDAGGVPQTAYDPITTASAHIAVSVHGELERPDWSAQVSREWEITLTGLSGTEASRTVNGAGQGSFHGTRQSDDGERSYTLVHEATLTDVVVPVAAPRWPLSGTLTRHFEVTRTGPRGEATRTRTVTVTFDGTREARLEADGVRFILDLVTGLTRRRD